MGSSLQVTTLTLQVVFFFSTVKIYIKKGWRSFKVREGLLSWLNIEKVDDDLTHKMERI